MPSPEFSIVENYKDGFQAKRDVSQLSPGALITGSQNIQIVDGDRVGCRSGISILGSASASGLPVTSLHTFKKSDGVQIQMYASGTSLYYRNPGTDTFYSLYDSYVSGLTFGFADFNYSTNSTNNDQPIDRVFFCNGEDFYGSWTGAIVTTTAALVGGETSIPVTTVFDSTVFLSDTSSTSSTTTLTPAVGTLIATDQWKGFFLVITSGAASGTIRQITSNSSTLFNFATIATLTGSVTYQIRKLLFDNVYKTIRIGTTNVVYTDITATSFVVGSAPAAALGVPVTQAVQFHTNAPKGNILRAYNARMIMGGVKSSPQTVYYSTIGDAKTWSFSSVHTAGQGGFISLPEGGGAVTGMEIQENTVVIFKPDIVKALTFTQDGTDLPQIDPLISSPFGGAVTAKSVFKIDNQVYYASANGGVKTVTRVENYVEQQSLQLSDKISKYIDGFDFSDSAGIFFNQKAYIACRSSSTTLNNDIVLVYNYQAGAWEAPIVGWNAKCWAIHDNSLYFGNSINTELYKIEPTIFADNAFAYESIAVFAFNHFGEPALQKQAGMLFMEGYITENTDITVEVLYNYYGAQESRSTVLSGTDTDVIVGVADYNLLGDGALGLDPLAGANADIDDLSKFRVYFLTPKQPFYEISIKVSSTKAGDRWEILRFGFDATVIQTPKLGIYKSLS